MTLYELSPYTASQFCKEFVDTVTELNEGKGLLFEVLEKLQKEEREENSQFLCDFTFRYIVSSFTYKQYMQSFSKSEFDDTKNKMLIILLDFRMIIAKHISYFMEELVETTIAQNGNEILVEKNTLDNFKKIFESYFQPLEFYLKENFNLTKEELCIYHIDLKLRESIVEFYTFLKNFIPTEKNDFDEKINDELHEVIAGTSKLTYGDCIHLVKNYKELEKNLFDF